MRLRMHFDLLVHDLRYASRGFHRSPLFTLAAVSALALGLGAGTAVFSVVDLTLFRSLPYRRAERLISVGMVAPIAPQEFMLAYDYLDWRKAKESPLESMGAWSGPRDCDLTDANPVRLSCAGVDAGFLPTLGIQPLRGRNFTLQEDRPNGPRAAIISHALWRKRFGADPAVAGKLLPLDGKPAIVAGVLPPQFEFPTLAKADVLVPLALDEVEQATRRTATLIYAIGRLKPGVGLPQAAAGLQPLFARSLEFVPPGFRKDVSLRIRPLRDRQIQEARLASWMLLASVLAVMLIACANVANLLLARGVARQHELAVRAALGAGRARLVRQALTESTLLGFAGCAAGCALASLLLRVFISIAPEGVPRLAQATVDLRVLLFAVALSLASGIAFGLVPAFQDPGRESLNQRHSTGTSHHLFRKVLIAVQISTSLVLLNGASLLMRSLWNLQNQPLGMRTDGVLTISLTLGQAAYSEMPRRLAFFEDLEARLRRLPGVADVALTDSLPPAGNPAGAMLYATIDVSGRPPMTNGTGGTVCWRVVTPGYFSVLQIPILRGRPFREEDRDPNRDAVILSEALARRLFPGENPVGKQIRPGRSGPWREVVGVAGNVKNAGLTQGFDPEYYAVRKHAAPAVGRSAKVVIRSAADPGLLAGRIRAEIKAMEPMLPVEFETLESQVDRLAARPRFTALLLGLFACIGLLLAAVGLYGVMSFLVARRTREIGVRMALGATRGGIAWMVLARAAGWTAAGAGLGLIGSLFAVRLLRSMLFQVSARDPLSLGVSAGVLMLVALLAAWIPSWRAARVDPIRALRQE